MLKLYFQDIHYLRQKPFILIWVFVLLAEFFYKIVINIKNYLYKINVLKETKVDIYTICVGNLTTGGVGKTPIVINIANSIKDKKVCVLSRGYGAKISNKNVTVIKDDVKLYFNDGSLCSDEAFQLAKNTKDGIIVLTCRNRLKGAMYAKEKYNCDILILDDGFSNRKIKKDKTILVIDSFMRFGNQHLLPAGPLREPVCEVERADEIYLVNKSDSNIDDAKLWVQKFNKPYKICNISPKRIYDIKTKQTVSNFGNAIAFCSIGQSVQFFNFAKEFYNLVDCVPFEDHHKYVIDDIEMLIKKAKEMNTKTFVTTQKDETKLIELINNYNEFEFNVLELDCLIN